MSISALNPNKLLRPLETIAKAPTKTSAPSSSHTPQAPAQAPSKKVSDAFEAGARLAGRLGSDLLSGQGKTPSASQPAAKPVPTTADGRAIPQATDKRPAGDTRSADQIVKDSPVLGNLGRQKDIKFDQLCQQTGVDPKLSLSDSKQNPDAVYRLSKVLEFIDSSPASDGSARPDQVKDGKGDGNIEGITKDGDARHGTEAGMVKDFAEQGYGFLNSQQTLPTTNDTHVNKDGSNKDNFQWGCGQAAKALFFIPGVSNVLAGIGNSKGGVGGAIEGALGGALHTITDGAKGVFDALKTGKINPIQMGLEVYKSELAGGTETPDIVKDIAGLIP